MNWRRTLPLISLAAFLFVLGFNVSYQTPRLKTVLIVKLEEFSKKHLPVRILPKNIHFHLWPLGMSLSDIRIQPKDELAKTLAPLFIKRARVELDWFSLLGGELRLAKITITQPQIVVIVKDTGQDDPKKSIVLPFSFRQLPNIPVDELSIEDALLMIRVGDPRILLKVSEFDIQLINLKHALFANIDLPNVYFRQLADTKNLAFSLSSKVWLDQNELNIASLKFRKDDSFIVGNASAKGRMQRFELTEYNVNARAHLDLPQIRQAILLTQGPLPIPELFGRLEMDLLLNQRPKSELQGQVSLITKNLAVNQFEIGNLQMQAKGSKDNLQISRIAVKNHYGSLGGHDLHLQRKQEKLSLHSAQIEMNKTEIGQLLNSIGIHNVPVHLLVTGELPCSGELTPNLALTCKGSLGLEDLRVWPIKKPEKPIVHAEKINVSGQVQVNAQNVKYDAQIKAGNDQGTSTGVIDYKTGFQIQFQTPNLDFANIKSLVGLKFNGAVGLSGATSGDSHAAKVEMQVNAKNFWFEDYGLGNLNANLAFKKGTLTLDNIQGNLNKGSTYSGDLSLNFDKDYMTLNAQMPTLIASDIIHSISRKVNTPFEVQAQGRGHIKLWGPIDIHRVNFNLHSHLNAGIAAGETFKSLRFDIDADNGVMRATQVSLIKGNGRADMKGILKPPGLLSTVIEGRNLGLDEIQLSSDNNWKLAGRTDFDLDLTGPLGQPNASLKGVVHQLIMSDRQLGKADYKLRFNQNHIAGGIELADNRLKSDFIFPTAENAPFVLNFDANKWDFTPFMAMWTGGSITDYSGLVTGKLKLESARGGFWNSSGHGEISELSISRPGHNVSAQNPIIIDVNRGKIRVKKFSLVGAETTLTANTVDSSQNKLDFMLNGKIDLNIFRFLVPFFEEMNGLLTMSLQIRGNEKKIETVGSSFIENGYLKLKELVHPFENVRADVLFNQNSVVINAIKSNFARGQLTADGKIQIAGSKKYPTLLNGTFSNVNMMIPDKVRTSGSGTFQITGSWFPFLFKADYNVISGMITREFGDEDTNLQKGRTSVYLPQFLQDDQFVPLTFQVNVQANQYIQVQNSIFDGSFSGNLMILGNTDLPILTGQLRARSDSKLLFRDTPFDISAMNLRFDADHVNDPAIYLAARSLVTTEDKNYDINLIVQGRSNKRTTNLSSQPPLAEQDIISLLALGITSTKQETRIGSEQASQGSYQIGSAIISNPVGKEIKARTGFEVKFSSPYDDTKDAAIPKITIKRQLTPKLGLSASRTMDGFPTSDVQLKYNLNRRISVIGSWEGREYDETNSRETKINDNSSILGLDLEYKVEFK